MLLAKRVLPNDPSHSPSGRHAIAEFGVPSLKRGACMSEIRIARTVKSKQGYKSAMARGALPRQDKSHEESNMFSTLRRGGAWQFKSNFFDLSAVSIAFKTVLWLFARTSCKQEETRRKFKNALLTSITCTANNVNATRRKNTVNVCFKLESVGTHSVGTMAEVCSRAS